MLTYSCNERDSAGDKTVVFSGARDKASTHNSCFPGIPLSSYKSYHASEMITNAGDMVERHQMFSELYGGVVCDA